MPAFEIKGRALVATMRFLDKMPAGSSLIAQLSPEDRKYFEEIFLESGWYDIEPYVRLMQAIATAQGVPIRKLMFEQSVRTAQNDVDGIYRMSLRSATPAEMAKRLPRAFNRYFQPAHAELRLVDDEHAEFVLHAIPAKHADFFRGINEGFVTGALNKAGAMKSKVSYGPPIRGQIIDGEATLELPFSALFG